MNEDVNQIIEELKTAGATQSEAEELAYFSKNLSNALSFKRSAMVKNKFLKKVDNMNSASRGNFFFIHRSLFASILGVILILSFATVVSAQDSLPGQPLYPVKRITENVISTVNPSFDSEILKRRSMEIKNLSNLDNKSIDNSQNVQSVIKDYETQLDEHENIDSKAIEESKINLQEATKNYSDGDKQEIEDILRKTEARQEDVKGLNIKLAPTSFESKTNIKDSNREDRTLENSSDH